MDKVSLLTSSHPDAGSSLVPAASEILHQLHPALACAFHIHRMLSSASVFLCLRAYVLASAAIYASRMAALQALLAARFSAAISGKALGGVWDSYPGRALRKRVFNELAGFVLGSGNVVFVLVFWPGWWVLGGTTLVAWKLWG